MSSTTEHGSPAPGDRRARRRQETIEEILAIAEDVMTEEGVNGLSLSEVARRLGVKPPSIYKYFDSLMAIYDALFERGQRAHLEVMRTAMAGAEPGLDALAAGLEASGRWALAHPADGAAAVLAPGPQLRGDARGHGPQRRDGPAPTTGAGRRRRRRTARPRCRLRRGALGHLGLRQRRHRPGAWPTSPASPGARAASARCSPSFSAHSPPSTPQSAPAAGRDTSAPPRSARPERGAA